MDGNKEATAHMLYADVVVLVSLPSVAPFGCAQGRLYPPPRRLTEYQNMLLPQSDKSMKSTLPPTFGTIPIFWLRPTGEARGRAKCSVAAYFTDKPSFGSIGIYFQRLICDIVKEIYIDREPDIGSNPLLRYVELCITI